MDLPYRQYDREKQGCLLSDTGIQKLMDNAVNNSSGTGKPGWIRGKISFSETYAGIKKALKEKGLNTVCVHAGCPNKGECWEDRHVTFMILGDACTRSCKFCKVSRAPVSSPDSSEPGKISSMITAFGIKYSVITSVTRDDIPDRGTAAFVNTTERIKKDNPGTIVELLIPDMDAREEFIRAIAFSGADVIGHNIEMPRELYARIRPGSSYERSLRTLTLLRELSARDIPIKTSMIVGLGETKEEVGSTFRDIAEIGVDILYIGQYLSPSGDNWLVSKYYGHDEFEHLKGMAVGMGIKHVLSGAMVRSSYKAGHIFDAWQKEAGASG